MGESGTLFFLSSSTLSFTVEQTRHGPDAPAASTPGLPGIAGRTPPSIGLGVSDGCVWPAREGAHTGAMCVPRAPGVRRGQPWCELPGCSSRPLQVGKLRQREGQRLFCTDLSSAGWPSSVSSGTCSAGPHPRRSSSGMEGRQRCWVGALGEWGMAQPSLGTRWRAGRWRGRPVPALLRSMAAAPASARPPAQAEPGRKHLNRPLKSFGAARWKIQRGILLPAKPLALCKC